MITIRAHLELSESNADQSRERCPWVVFASDDHEVVRRRTDAERLSLPYPDGGVGQITLHDDALSRVMDEEAWLAELGRILTPGGELRFTVPKTGAFCWLDAMDVHRYAVDIGKRGDAPDASLPTGWNRHYGAAELRDLCRDVGLNVDSVTTINYAVDEVRLIAGLLWRNWIRGDRDAERELWPQFGRRDPEGKASLAGTTWSVTARKVSLQ